MPPTSCARLRDARALAALGLAAGITVPAALLGGPQAAALPAGSVPASLAADQQPVCGDPDAKDFPIETRIQDAPDRYASGGGYGTWFLDLTNTTDTSCRALHPVLVLADGDRRLTSDQIQLEFSEPGRPGIEHRVTWESTDRDEQIGVFGGEQGDKREEREKGEDGEAGEAGTSSGTGTGTGSSGSGEKFLGFTVPAGKTVSVRVRMAFTSDTAPGPVTAHAAVVQRRHQDKAKGGGREDGEWVGESEKYPFVIVDGATGGIPEPERPQPERPQPERPQPERPQPESPQPESPQPESLQPESPRSERPDPKRTAPEHTDPERPDPELTDPERPDPELTDPERPDPELTDPERHNPERPDPERTDPGAGTRTEPPGDPDGTRTDPGTGRVPSPDRDSSPRPPARPGTGEEGDGRGADEERPGLPPRDGMGRPLPELARTGPPSLPWAGATAGALLLGGVALVRHARRMRRATD